MGWAIELRKPRTGRRPCGCRGKATLVYGDTSRASARPGVVKDPSTSRSNMHENRETSLASRLRDRSGKANNHNPGMYAREGSDCAIVPVKELNKGAKVSAEVLEGRAQTKENAAGPHTRPTQSGITRVPRVPWRAPRGTDVYVPLDAFIRGKSRVRQFRSHGSVRGAVSDGRPYRD